MSILENRLLAAMSFDEQERWASQLEPITFSVGDVLYESRQDQHYLYFPTTAIVSLSLTTEEGNSTEIAVVGNEGVIGISSFMGGVSSIHRAVVVSAGKGFRLSSAAVKVEFDQGNPIMGLLLRYTQARMTQVSQMTICNRYHVIDQQLCRWLLMALDRIHGNVITMTQELIASMLGRSREGVAAAATKLQEAGIIRYSRGKIAVLDRAELELRSCECYETIKNEFDRLLPSVHHNDGWESTVPSPLGIL